MDDVNTSIGAFCKNEILAEILFHDQTSKTRDVKLLCSRLLARHRLWGTYNTDEVLEKKCSNDITTHDENHVGNHSAIDYKDEPLTNDKIQCLEDVNEPCMDSFLQSVSNIEDTCSSILEQLNNLNTSESQENAKYEPCMDSPLQAVSSSEDTCSRNIDQLNDSSTSESQLNAKWYEYWEKNGENIVAEIWMKKYENCTIDELPIDVDDSYKKHREQIYQMLYFQFVSDMYIRSEKIDDCNYTNYQNTESDSTSSVDLNDVDSVSSFEFIFKYKHFGSVNPKLVRAYRALSLIGYSYNDELSFTSAYVKYLKTNLIKSTRRLNVYKFPNRMKSNEYRTETTSLNSETDFENSVISYNNEQDNLSYLNNMSKNNVEASEKNNEKKSKKSLKKDKFKQEKAKCLEKQLERNGCSYMQSNPKLLKYWKKRHLLFSQFDKGILLDEESWYSVTPEIISAYIADRCSCYLLVDAFCGAGGNTIQFAKTCQLVIAIDIDPKKIEMARHNAELYGVSDRIQFIVGDYFALAPTLKADVVFLSPPWGGPDIMGHDECRLGDIMANNGGVEHILSSTRKITSDIALHLPKNINIFDCIKSAEHGLVEVQQNMLNSRYNSVTVYYNDLYGLGEEDTVEYEM